MKQIRANWIMLMGILATGGIVIAVGLWIRELRWDTWVKILLNEVVGVTLIACGFLVFEGLSVFSTHYSTNTHNKNAKDNSDAASPRGIDETKEAS